MPDRVLLHVGTHRTGTTSIQLFLREHNDTVLAAAGVHYPPGFLLPVVHTELPLLIIRPGWMWPARLRFPETQRPSWLAAARAHVRHHLCTDPRETLAFVQEDLSYLRSAEELERLRDLFADTEAHIAIFLREPQAFLRSCAAQLTATGFELTDDPGSFAYLEPDSWLVDYEALVAGYRTCFGDDRVHVVDYDRAIEEDGSVIPAYAALLGIDRSELPDLERYHVNRTGSAIRLSDDQLATIRADIVERYP
jgi:hypothetical protein